MERLNSWLSPEVTHALGWALIHSLWQCLAVAALAAGLMALSRRPNIRYVIGLGALALTLAAPAATFFVLMRPIVPVQALLHAGPAAFPAAIPGSPISATAASADGHPVAALSGAVSDRAIAAFANSSRHFPHPDILPWLVGAWLCGVGLLSLRLAGGFLLLEHRLRSQSGALSPRILAMCQEVQRQLGLDRAIRYLECDWLQTPAVVGWLRPIVFLPVSALTGLSEAQLRAVIAHELAHIRRFDAFVNLFQILSETLLFYHPAIWLVAEQAHPRRPRAMLRRDRGIPDGQPAGICTRPHADRGMENHAVPGDGCQSWPAV
jgi:Zn-dependent protease with chaperone function